MYKPKYTPSLEESHRERCESQGHQWVGAASGTMPIVIYEVCKWCGIKHVLPREVN